MTWWLYVLIVIVIIIALLLLFAPQLFYPNVSTELTGPYKLNVDTPTFDSNAALRFVGSASSTFQGFFYVVPLLRTPTAIVCGTPGNPSCEDGRFQMCDCGKTRNCGSCKRNGYVSLFNISNICSLEIMSAPDAGRQGKALAQLAIQTETNMDASGNPVDASGGSVDASGSSTVSQNYVEFIPLPAIPLQRWVMITVVREGRRFDIYYNDKLVASKKTTYYIAIPDDKKAIHVGNAGFKGYAAFLKCMSSALHGGDVSSAYKKLSDTRGAPYVKLPEEDAGVVAGLQMPSFTMPTIPSGIGFQLPSFCPSGGCLTMPDVRPAQPWLEWDTDYA